MVCEQILGKLSEFDTSGKTIEYVDIEWHEAFKKIHKKTTDHGTELGIRMDDSILTRVCIRVMCSMQTMKKSSPSIRLRAR